MKLMPAGAIDPTPFIYDTTCYVAAGLMDVLANLAIQPLAFVEIATDLDKNNGKQRKRSEVIYDVRRY